MKILLLLIFASCASLPPRGKICSLTKNSCPMGFVCSLKGDQPLCMSQKQKPWKIIGFPIQKGSKVKCLAGNIDYKSSHLKDENLYALTFSNLDKEEPAEIIAAHDGKVAIYNECPYLEAHNQAKNYTLCGMGLGNHIKIFSEEGYISVYGHLSEIYVHEGQKVKKGTLLGKEGASGAAGKRKLHFSLHRPIGPFVILRNPGHTGISIPFVMQVRLKNENKNLESTDFQCKKDYTGLTYEAPL